MSHKACGLAAIALAVFLDGSAWAKDKETKAPEEATLDQFTMGDVLNGVPFKAEDLKGSPAVIEFWGVHCPPCVASLPELVKLQKKYDSKGLKIVGVHRQNAPDEEILKVLKTAKVSYPVVRGGTAPLKNDGIPHAFVFGRDGKMVWRGSPHDEAFMKAVRSVVK